MPSPDTILRSSEEVMSDGESGMDADADDTEESVAVQRRRRAKPGFIDQPARRMKQVRRRAYR